VNLSYQSAFTRFPFVRWLLAHAGGTLPFLAYRTSLLQYVTPIMQNTGLGILDGQNFDYGRLFYDTALSPAPSAMMSVREVAPVSHIMFATDWPFSAEIFTIPGDPAPQLPRSFNSTELTKVLRTNALDQSQPPQANRGLTMNVLHAADRLTAAAANRTPCAPVRDLIGTDIAMAYDVQRAVIARRGGRVVGRKIGLTSPAVQQQLGVDQPDFGVLLDEMDFTGRDVPMSRLLQPKAEAELAYVLGEDLTIASTHVALEIVDSRIAGWDITYADTVADNASSGLFVLGPEVHVEPRLVEMKMRLNGEVVSTGNGEACLGDPLDALGWLAETARSFGDPLRAGQVVLSVALGPMVSVVAGNVVETSISGTTLTVRFVEEGPS